MFQSKNDTFTTYRENVDAFLTQELGFNHEPRTSMDSILSTSKLISFGDGIIYNTENSKLETQRKELDDAKKAIEYYAFRCFCLYRALEAVHSAIDDNTFYDAMSKMDKKFKLETDNESCTIYNNVISDITSPDYYLVGRHFDEFDDAKIQSFFSEYCDYLWLQKKVANNSEMSKTDEEKYEKLKLFFDYDADF
ncbi:hypothetical protein J6X09_00080 [Candidatus Saccharibacteria bacterium]|nr:hypothetical protein [Candidatus Saccharibacteria bacterium]